jgi:hypothetical protein
MDIVERWNGEGKRKNRDVQFEISRGRGKADDAAHTRALDKFWFSIFAKRSELPTILRTVRSLVFSTRRGSESIARHHAPQQQPRPLFD